MRPCDDDEDAKSESLRAVVDLVNKQEFLLLLHIVRVGEGGSQRRISVQVSTDATANDVKGIVRGRWGIPFQNQRLFRADDGQLILHTNTVLGESRSPQVTLHLRVVELDPRLEAVFQMVSIDDASNERDEMMMKMKLGRNPGECPKGHPIPNEAEVEEDEDDGVSPDDAPHFSCAKCHFDSRSSGTRNGVELALRPCTECGDWALCNFCLAEDEGIEQRDDTYQALEELALELASRRASQACWFGGKGHLCGYPPVRWENELGPKLYSTRFAWRHDERPRITPRAQVIHPGARLHVRIKDDLRSILLSKSIQELERVEVLPEGATVRDLTGIRESPRRRGCWELINTTLREQHPDYRTVDGLPATAYMTMSLLAYGIDDVVLEIGASISDGDY